jgi:uncharacterized protein DUF6644
LNQSEPNVQGVTDFLGWLADTELSVFIRESAWAFPAIESVHVIAIALVVGTIAIVDLRLVGLASTGRSCTELSREVLPWTWGAFAIAATMGTLMFISQPVEYFHNTAFRIKILLLVLAGVNMLVFQLITCRSIAQWDRAPAIPLAGRIAGMLSLAFWVAIVFFGRRVGFTMSPT